MAEVVQLLLNSSVALCSSLGAEGGIAFPRGCVDKYLLPSDKPPMADQSDSSVYSSMCHLGAASLSTILASFKEGRRVMPLPHEASPPPQGDVW